MASGDLIPRVYSNFRGVDFRGEEINLVRSPDSLNMWKDYKETDSIRTRPALEKVPIIAWKTQGEKINGIFHYCGHYMVHNGTKLISDGVMPSVSGIQLATDIKDAKSSAFIHNNNWYFKDGKEYYVTSPLFLLEKVEGYVPTTSIGRKATGGGTIHEDVNLLTGRRINTFLADGTSKDYYLDAQNIDTNFTPIVKVNSTKVTNFTVDYTAGKITFATAPTKPLTDGQDNVSIEFSKTISGYRERITECTLLEVFDNRVFFSGNKDFPNVVWHCSLEDPSYVSDLDYYNEGLDSAAVTGLVAGNNALWVFREPSDSHTTVFYHTPTIDSDYGKIYPSVHSSISTGCIGKAINFNDDIVFFSDRGMEGISGDVTTEQVAAHRSSLVDRKMIAEPDYKNMILAEWEGYLLVFIDNHVYLADSRAVYTNEDHIEYEWFYWELDVNVVCATVYKGVLYVGSDDGIYTFSDTDKAVESYWVTPKDKFQYPQMLKTTNKRGCVVEAKGDVSVYAKLEDTEFVEIGNYENVEDYFVCRIKRKKFKDLQLKFYSPKGFSLEAATLECWIGGYIKR